MDPAVTQWIAIGAACVAVAALGLVGWMIVSLRRVRGVQRALLPEGATGDLVARQHDLQRGVERVETGIGDLEALVTQQARATELALRRALRFQGLVRYDAYRDMGGQQSWSIAFLDANRDGAVITCLHARDHARVYLKELAAGVAGQRLSPEEERAVAAATAPHPGQAVA